MNIIEGQKREMQNLQNQQLDFDSMIGSLQSIGTEPSNLVQQGNMIVYKPVSMYEKYGDIFYDKYRWAKYLIGDDKPKKPEVLRIDGDIEAREMLMKHINQQSLIVVHTDVDLDGVGSCKIFIEWLRSKFIYRNIQYTSNQNKVHGINEGFVKTVNSFIDTQIAQTGEPPKILVVILDSSCNETELLKGLKCDALVIDHHKISTSELCGDTQNGRFVVLNYLSGPNKDFESLSAGMELFEFIRGIEYYEREPTVEKLQLYQWAVATLFSDHMNNDNPRNLYWITRAFSDVNKEPALNLILQSLGRHDTYLSKSNINFSLAPIINGAVRAGASLDALNYVLWKPNQIHELRKYLLVRDQMLVGYNTGVYEFPGFVAKETQYPNYAGLIASKLLDEYDRTAIVYRMEGDVLVGSFRGKTEVDYCEAINQLGFKAEGHPGAFGFRIPAYAIMSVMQYLVSLEGTKAVPYLAYGPNSGISATHNIKSLTEFRNDGMLWKLAILNSHLSENVNILAPTSGLTYIRRSDSGKMLTYGVEEFELTAFQEMKKGTCSIYIENQDMVRLYVKNT